MEKLVVNTASKTYPVLLAPTLGDVGVLSSYCKGNKVLIVTDTNVAPLYAQTVAKALGGKQVTTIVLAAGEESKSLATYGAVLDAMVQNEFTRQDTVLALGGGVIGDLAGFAASTYMRGVGLVAVPTSLLAMVDSSVGGKTAVNLGAGKNLCGTFYQPDAVYIALDTLATLPQRETLCGWGEIIKYAFLGDVELHDLEGDVTPQLIAKCLQIKADIVGKDERENGMRKLLNLGHTFGHAIERNCDFALSHGECVVKGMAIALSVSQRYYALPQYVVEKARKLLSVRGHDLSCPYDVKTLLMQIKLDKKSTDKGVDMVLIDSDLLARIVPITFAQFDSLL